MESFSLKTVSSSMNHNVTPQALVAGIRWRRHYADVFVPQDTTGVTSYLSTVLNKGLTIQFTFQYTDNNREKMSQYDTEEALVNYLRQQGLVEKFIRYAENQRGKEKKIS